MAATCAAGDNGDWSTGRSWCSPGAGAAGPGGGATDTSGREAGGDRRGGAAPAGGREEINLHCCTHTSHTRTCATYLCTRTQTDTQPLQPLEQHTFNERQNTHTHTHTHRAKKQPRLNRRTTFVGLAQKWSTHKKFQAVTRFIDSKKPANSRTALKNV